VAPRKSTGERLASVIRIASEASLSFTLADETPYNCTVRRDRNPLDDSFGFPVSRPEPGKHVGPLGYLRSRFITGILVAFPLVVTIFFGRFIFNLFDRWSYPITARLFGFSVPGAGAALAIVLIFLLGVVAHNVLGRRILHVGERVLARVPVLRAVYNAAREVTRAFGRDRSQGFRRVVLVPFPSPGVWSVAFLTGEFELPTEAGPQVMVAVFMPTTPNPTTGFYCAYSKDDVRFTDISIEEALRSVISGGLATPEPTRLFGTLGKPPVPPGTDT